MYAYIYLLHKVHMLASHFWQDPLSHHHPVVCVCMQWRSRLCNKAKFRVHRRHAAGGVCEQRITALRKYIYMILKFGFEYSFQICHEYSNIRYWMTSGIGLPYINIAVAESADRLARSFDVTLCKHCVLQSTSTRPIYHRVLRWPLHTARSCRYVRTFTLTCSCATVANGLRVCKKVSRLLPSILG